ALMTNSDHLDLAALNTELLTLLLKAGISEPEVPKVRGPAAKEAALALLRQLREGEGKRSELGEDFSRYLTEERLRGAKDRLRALGEPETTVVEETHERGGMEVAVIRFTFKGGKKVKAYVYRTPDGKVQEFLFYQG